MQKFRKNPIVIHAVQFTEANRNEWLPLLDPHTITYRGNGLHGYIATLEGQMQLTDGDWIIQGIAGDLYPCRDDIFRRLYEAVD